MIQSAFGRAVRVPARAGVVAGLLAAALSLSACGTGATPEAEPSATAAPLTIAAPTTTEGQIVGHLYAGALRAAGFKAAVAVKPGTRAEYLKQVAEGPVDVVVDYTGQMLVVLEQTREDDGGAEGDAEEADAAESAAPSTPDEVADALREALPETVDLLSPSEADAAPVLVTTRARAAQHDLAGLGDLGADVCQELAFAGAAPRAVARSWTEPATGLSAVRENYECTPKSFIETADDAETLEVLLDDTAQVALLSRTDPMIVRNGLTTLDDPDRLFAAEQIAAVVNQESVPEGARAALNRVSERLNTETLTHLNAETLGDAPLTPREAAETWLVEAGIDS